jgi:hypothetical protein
MSQLKSKKNLINNSTKKEKIIKDAQKIIDAATVLGKLKFDGDKYTIKSDSSNDSDSSDSSDSSDDSDDDVEIWNGKKYYYHPPEVNDKVKALWNDGIWYVGTITNIYPPTKTNKKNRYLVTFDKITLDKKKPKSRAEKWKLELPIENYPKKWHFEDDGIKDE